MNDAISELPLFRVGGGPGVEHLAELYTNLHLKTRKKSASERLNVEAMEKPRAYFEYEPPTGASAAPSNLSLTGRPDVEDFVSRFLSFVTNLAAPRVFFAHLLNKSVGNYRSVRNFFDQVVSKITSESGFSRFDSGLDASEEPFLNVEIFKMIHQSSLVIVDLTMLRPNCLVELGYALGTRKKVIVTALHGTRLPFDTEALPCHFWWKKVPIKQRRKEFREFVSLNVNRRKIN